LLTIGDIAALADQNLVMTPAHMLRPWITELIPSAMAWV
jgi:hypothetical protein